jgi:hypothetical protein
MEGKGEFCQECHKNVKKQIKILIDNWQLAIGVEGRVKFREKFFHKFIMSSDLISVPHFPSNFDGPPKRGASNLAFLTNC